MDILLIIIIANTILSTIWMLIRLIRKKDIKYVIIFYFTPVLGFMIYYFPRWTLMIRKRVGYDRASLVNRIPVEESIEQINLEEAFRVVPLQDVLAEGSDTEKRQLLLERLKKDMNHSYEMIKDAKDDSDSESVHYVSSVRMELYNKYYSELEMARKDFEKINDEEFTDNRDEIKTNFFSVLSEFIHSDLLQEIEKKIYMEEFCKLFVGVDKNLFKKAYNDYMLFLCNLDYEKEILQELDEKNTEYWTYEIYNQLLDYSYRKKRKDDFYWIMENLKKSNILLDQRGIELIRYWQEGGKDNVID